MTNISDTLAKRQSTHGSFIDNARVMQQLKSIIRDHQNIDAGFPRYSILDPYQREALDMIAQKIGRILSGNPGEPDHWHDIAGYATLVEKILRGEYK